MCYTTTQGSQPEFIPAETSSLPAVTMSPGHAIETRNLVGEPEYDTVMFHAKSQHTNFRQNLAPTSKCDNCEERNVSVIQQCTDCAFNICHPCWNKPPEERRDRGQHFAPEADVDWWPRNKMITYKKRQKDPTLDPTLGSAEISGKKRRHRKVLPGPPSGVEPDLSKNSLVEEMNERVNNDIVTEENTATYSGKIGVTRIPAEVHNQYSSRNVIGTAGPRQSERLSSANEPFPPCEADDGFFLPELHSYKVAVKVDNQIKIEVPPPERPHLKRKLSTSEAEGQALAIRTRLIGELPSVGNELPHQTNRVANCDVTKRDPNLTEDGNDAKRQKLDSTNSSSVLPGRPGGVPSRGGLSGLTRVQVQILGFLTENNKKPIMLAGYRELLQLELRRVEEALGMMRMVDSAR